MLADYLLCKDLDSFLRMLFSEALIKDGVNKETIFQPLRPLGEYNYFCHLRNNINVQMCR